LPGSGQWEIGGRMISDRLQVPALHLLARHDRIAPDTTAPGGEAIAVASGHVGMIVGSARAQLHEALAGFLTPCR
jgi:polyhydroxyalkanoate synthase